MRENSHVRTLLVTNDFPPKIGGIQSYLGCLWAHFAAEETVVYTPRTPGWEEWDAQQPWPVIRSDSRYMLGAGRLASRIAALADEHEVDLVLADPVFMVGPAMIHPNFGGSNRSGQPGRTWAPILHGAEITVPGRILGAKSLMRSVLNRAPFVVSAGGYPLAEAERIVGSPLDSVMIPPGVDTDRFRPIDAAERERVRRLHGIEDRDVFVLGLSRLVPRKGFDVLIEAAHLLADRWPALVIGIGGSGRDEQRLSKLARSGPGRVNFLGRVPETELVSTYAASDAFAMLCRNRWAGYEQEGFGIVFLEAAATEVPVIAGRSGGSHEAVDHGVTGLVVDTPEDPAAVAAALDEMLSNEAARRTMGEAGRKRAIAEFDYAVLAARLRQELEARVEAVR